MLTLTIYPLSNPVWPEYGEGKKYGNSRGVSLFCTAKLHKNINHRDFPFKK
jgi:hypothetical protein